MESIRPIPFFLFFRDCLVTLQSSSMHTQLPSISILYGVLDLGEQTESPSIIFSLFVSPVLYVVHCMYDIGSRPCSRVRCCGWVSSRCWRRALRTRERSTSDGRALPASPSRYAMAICFAVEAVVGLVVFSSRENKISDLLVKCISLRDLLLPQLLRRYKA